MSTSGKMRILCVGAHPDDIELMAGGSIAGWVKEGHRVNILTISDGVWSAPDGTLMRDDKEALGEERRAARKLGVAAENLGRPAMDLKFEDALVREVLQRVDKLKIDTIVCPWERDIHHDHEIASRIAVSASRRVPRVLMGQINFYLRDVFTPNLFVDITKTWDKKIDALKCYTTQWDRAGKEWHEFLDETTRYYGRMAGVKRAEGFITKKFLL